MTKGHYLKQNNEFNNLKVQDLIIENNVQYMIGHYNLSKRIEFLKGPIKCIEMELKKSEKYYKRLIQNKATMSFTYKDNINKEQFINIVINNLQLEYNSKHKIVACIINNSFRIDYNTRYCPIIHKILV